MMHFFRRSKIHLDCFTYRRDVIEYAPVVNAIDVIPEWWKALPKKVTKDDGFSPTGTMKTCVGMYDYYAKSIAMPLWSDLCINVTPNRGYNWQFSDNYTEATVHPAYQYGAFGAAKDYGHLKVNNPWLFSTNSNVNWLMTDPVYNKDEFRNYVLAQGMLNFSTQRAAHLQMFVDIKEPKIFTIPFHTIFMLTPMSEKKVVIHRHLISQESWASKKSLSFTVTFINKLKSQQKIVKCPYKDNIK